MNNTEPPKDEEGTGLWDLSPKGKRLILIAFAYVLLMMFLGGVIGWQLAGIFQ